jgi:hypothetical protein
MLWRPEEIHWKYLGLKNACQIQENRIAVNGLTKKKQFTKRG